MLARSSFHDLATWLTNLFKGMLTQRFPHSDARGLNHTRVAYEKVALQVKVFSGSLAILQGSLHFVALDEP
jgi:hypothetical protein